MNDFDNGFVFGRFFVSWIINDDFCGIAIRIGKEHEMYEDVDVYHITAQLGYGQLTIGIISGDMRGDTDDYIR